MTRPPWVACQGRTDTGVSCSFRARWWFALGGNPPRALCGTHANLWRAVQGAVRWPLITDDPDTDRALVAGGVR